MGNQQTTSAAKTEIATADFDQLPESEYINIPKKIASRIDYPPESRKSQALAALFLFSNQEYELEQLQRNNNNNENINSELFHCNETVESIAAASYSIADSLKAFDEHEQALFQKMEENNKLNPINAMGHKNTHLLPIAYRYFLHNAQSESRHGVRAITVHCGVNQLGPRQVTSVAAGDVRYVIRYIEDAGPDAESPYSVVPSTGTMSLLSTAFRFKQLDLVTTLVKLGLRGSFESWCVCLVHSSDIIGGGESLQETVTRHFSKFKKNSPNRSHSGEFFSQLWRDSIGVSVGHSMPMLPPAYAKFWYEVGHKTLFAPGPNPPEIFERDAQWDMANVNDRLETFIARVIGANPNLFPEWFSSSESGSTPQIINLVENMFVNSSSMYLATSQNCISRATTSQQRISAEDNSAGTVAKSLPLFPFTRLIYLERASRNIDVVPFFSKFADPKSIDELVNKCFEASPAVKTLVVDNARRLPALFVKHLRLLRKHFMACGDNPLLQFTNDDAVDDQIREVSDLAKELEELATKLASFFCTPFLLECQPVCVGSVHRVISAAMLARQTRKAHRQDFASISVDEATETLRNFEKFESLPRENRGWYSLATHGAIDCWESQNIDDDTTHNEDGFVRRQLAFPSKALDEEFFTLFRSEHRANPGQPCFSSRQEFGAKWNKFAQGVLDGYSSPYAWAIGGAVVTCLDPNITEASMPASTNRDIDIVFAGLTPLGVNLELVRFDNFIRTKFPTISSPDDESSKLGHLACHTRSTITYVLPFPLPRIQIVLGAWSNIETCLRYSDVDCCGVALSLDLEREENYHSSQQQIQVPHVVCTPRSLHSWIYKVNVVTQHAHAIRGSIQYEIRLLKYARRHGFAVVHHDINPTTSEAVKKLRSPSIQEQLPNMTLTSGATWLFMADIGKFKPKLDVPSALDVSSTRGLKQVKEQILEDGYLESDNYGQHEEGYQLFSSQECLISEDELSKRFDSEKRKRTVSYLDDDLRVADIAEPDDESVSFPSHILRPHPGLSKLSSAFPGAIFGLVSNLFNIFANELDDTPRQLSVNALGLGNIFTPGQNIQQLGQCREGILLLKYLHPEHYVEVNGWFENVDYLENAENDDETSE